MTSLFENTDNDDILVLQPRLTDADAGVRRIALIELADLEEPEGLLWLELPLEAAASSFPDLSATFACAGRMQRRAGMAALANVVQVLLLAGFEEVLLVGDQVFPSIERIVEHRCATVELGLQVPGLGEERHLVELAHSHEKV